MLKMVYLIRRRPELGVDEFRRYWTENHGPIAARLPGLRKYVQHHVVPNPDGSDPEFDGFAEMWWDDADALSEALASPEFEAALADAQSFLDWDRTQGFSVEQVPVV